MKTMNTKHIIFAVALCLASFATADVVDAVFAKAKEAEDDGSVNFCGFYVGMSKADAEVLVSHYKLKDDESSIDGDPVYSINLSLKGVRRITKGGNSYDELCEAVANRVGRMNTRSASIWADSKWSDDEWWYEYDTIDGIRVTMAENGHSGAQIQAGFTMFDEVARNNAAEKAEIERKAAERKAAEARREKIRTRLDATPDVGAIVKAMVDSMVDIPGKKYKIGKFEVTQEQWESVMGENPSSFVGTNNPVENVSWDDVEEFLGFFNSIPAVKESRLTFRLPTEEEWNYACAAGREKPRSFCKLWDGRDVDWYETELRGKVAWFENNSEGMTHPIGQKMPNAFGLYDMNGNVSEWISETDGEYRGHCGGSWDNIDKDCEPWTRLAVAKRSTRSERIGFRLCADWVPSPEPFPCSDISNDQIAAVDIGELAKRTIGNNPMFQSWSGKEKFTVFLSFARLPRNMESELMAVFPKVTPPYYVFHCDNVASEPTACADVNAAYKAFLTFCEENQDSIVSSFDNLK